MQNGTITYRYKKGNPVSWQVPIGSKMVNKEVTLPDGTKRMLPKKVAYYPGATSIFAEDNVKSDLPKKNIWLEDQGNGFTEAYIPADDYNLILLIESTNKFGVDYEKYDPNQEALKSLDLYDARDKANDMLRNISDSDAKSMAFAVFEYDAVAWTAIVAKAKLKEKAYEKPHFIIEKLTNSDYQAKKAAGGAYYLEIVKSDPTENHVIWADTEEPIIAIPTGQYGLNVLAKHLSTTDGRITMQRIGEAMGIKTGDKKVTMVTASMDSAGYDIEDLESVKEEYMKVMGKNVPPNKFSDIAWLNIKIAEAKAGANA